MPSTVPTPPTASAVDASSSAPPAPSATAYNAAISSTIKAAQREFVQTCRAATKSKAGKTIVHRISVFLKKRNRSSMSPPDHMAIDAVPVPPAAAVGNVRNVAAEAAIVARSMDALKRSEQRQPTSSIPDPDDATIIELIRMASEHVCDVPQLRDMQESALNMLFDSTSMKRLLNIAPTGGGKTLVMKLLGIILKGVHEISHPILALTADQVLKFATEVNRFGEVEVHNLDAASSAHLKRIATRIRNLKTNTTSTIFVFYSPQFLVHNPKWKQLLLKCAEKGTLRGSHCDEAHLVAAHGSSFRVEYRYLSEHYYKYLFTTNRNIIQPIHMASTATMSKRALKQYNSLMHIGFGNGSTLWSTADAFSQQFIEMQQVVTSAYTRNLDLVVQHVKEKEGAVFIFANSKALTHKLLPLLEAKLDKAELDEHVDCLHVHGSLSMEEKCGFINLFCSHIKVRGYNPRVMIATSSADLGIDHDDLRLVLNCEWPDSISTYVQRRGRGSRDGCPSTTVLIAGVSSYLSLMKRIFRNLDAPADDFDDDPNNVIVGLNAAVVTPRKEKKKDNIVDAMNREHRLTTVQRRHLVTSNNDDLQEVMSLFCLNRGCQHLRIQQYLAHGEMRDDLVDAQYSCNNCPICNKTWHDYFLPLRKEGVKLWLRECPRDGTIPCKGNVKSLFDSLHKKEKWIKAVFDLVTVNKYNVESFFLQMIGAEFITVKRKGDEVWWVISSTKISDLKTIDNFEGDNWSGINLHSDTRNWQYSLD